jgi:hypothetical protein
MGSDEFPEREGADDELDFAPEQELGVLRKLEARGTRDEEADFYKRCLGRILLANSKIL